MLKGNTAAIQQSQESSTAANNAAAEQYLSPNYTVQSPYSTINVSLNEDIYVGSKQSKR